MTNILLQTKEECDLLAKMTEVTNHPAWCGRLDEKMVIDCLQDEPVMTYLIWQGAEGPYDLWLSHKKSPWEVHHRHFTIRRLPNGWHFANHRAPSCKNLEGFIQGALACRE
jgi:hypothetical protein